MTKFITDNNATQLSGYATRWKGLIFISIALLVISIDNTIMSVALPSISRELQATTSQLQWLDDCPPRLLHTVRGIGYVWREDEQSDSISITLLTL